MSQKQQTTNTTSSTSIDFFKNEKIEILEAKIAKLNKICDEVNPYQELSEEMKNQLRELGILEFSNPFHITNTLVMILEDTIDELHQIKPFEVNEF